MDKVPVWRHGRHLRPIHGSCRLTGLQAALPGRGVTCGRIRQTLVGGPIPVLQALAYCHGMVRVGDQQSQARRLALIGGYGIVAGAIGVGFGTVVTRLSVGAHGGTEANVTLAGVVTVVAVVAGLVGGPLLIRADARFEGRCRRR